MPASRKKVVRPVAARGCPRASPASSSSVRPSLRLSSPGGSGLGLRSVRTGVVPRLIAGGPRPEWRLGELTVVVGPERAELRYAREPVGFAPPSAEAIGAAVERARQRLAARSRAPDELLPALVGAYEAVLAARGARPGDRVPLVELRDQIAGTRAQFAWDLARLRRERRLVIAGRRLDLGVATGHAASQRSRVVWIENDGGGGSYFQSFRLIAQEARS